MSGGTWQYDRSGGGLWMGDGATAIHCVITGSEAATGGGVFLFNGGTLLNSHIADNISSNEAGGVRCEGGGFVADCLIEDNTAQSSSGGVYLNNGNAQMERCEVRHNECVASGSDGGGVRVLSSGTVRNCLITQNSANNTGGGLFFSATVEGRVLIENCTVVSNLAEYGGGLRTWGDTVRNCIVFDNTGTIDNDNWRWGGNSPSFEYTCTTPTNGIPEGTGCFTNAPLFAGNFHLNIGSPCIDAGTNGSNTIDFDGTPRPLDGDADGTATVDIGCYEVLNRTADSDTDTMPDGWEADHGLDPTDPSDQSANPDTDPFSNLQEYIADTDPLDSNDWFCITAISNGTVFFDSSAARRYIPIGTTDLVSNVWNPVQEAQMGAGGSDAMTSTNNLPVEFYKLTVEPP